MSTSMSIQRGAALILVIEGQKIHNWKDEKCLVSDSTVARSSGPSHNSKDSDTRPVNNSKPRGRAERNGKPFKLNAQANFMDLLIGQV